MSRSFKSTICYAIFVCLSTPQNNIAIGGGGIHFGTLCINVYLNIVQDYVHCI